MTIEISAPFSSGPERSDPSLPACDLSTLTDAERVKKIEKRLAELESIAAEMAEALSSMLAVVRHTKDCPGGIRCLCGVFDAKFLSLEAIELYEKWKDSNK